MALPRRWLLADTIQEPRIIHQITSVKIILWTKLRHACTLSNQFSFFIAHFISKCWMNSISIFFSFGIASELVDSGLTQNYIYILCVAASAHSSCASQPTPNRLCNFTCVYARSLARSLVVIFGIGWCAFAADVDLLAIVHKCFTALCCAVLCCVYELTRHTQTKSPTYVRRPDKQHRISHCIAYCARVNLHSSSVNSG